MGMRKSEEDWSDRHLCDTHSADVQKMIQKIKRLEEAYLQ